MTCSPWFALYAVTAILWATYAARMARQEYGSNGRWRLSFVVNLLLCPAAILWASIWKANATAQGRAVASTLQQIVGNSGAQA